jgi:hypothetical protein
MLVCFPTKGNYSGFVGVQFHVVCKNNNSVHEFIIIISTFLTKIRLTPGDSITVHIYTQTVHRTHRTEHM